MDLIHSEIDLERLDSLKKVQIKAQRREGK